LLVIPLRRVDPLTAQIAVNLQFVDEPLSIRPRTDVDASTNTLFVQGTESQLARVRRTLRDLGENVRDPNQPVMPQAPASPIRTIEIRGGADTLRELERLWRETEPNPMQIIRESEIPSQFSVEDEIQRGQPAEESSRDLSAIAGLFPSAAPVYIIVGEDGSLTITSSDTEALDRLEAFLQRIESRIVHEGRDFTMFAVRNLSADIVAARVRQMIWLQVSGRQQQPGTSLFAAPVMPEVIPDLPTNTILVRGSRMWRDEAEKLIAMLDVTDWGERTVLRPVTVQIENIDANRVFQEVMNVYQQTLMSILLPGGTRPRIVVNNTRNTLEIFAPEPLVSELKEYALEVDRRALEEPARQIHVIPLGVKASVVEQVLQQVRWQQTGFGGMPMQPGMMMPMQMQPWGGMMPMQMQPFGGMMPGGMRGGMPGIPRQW